MKLFLNSLLSRKFLLTVAGALALLSAKQYDQFVLLVLGFLGVEGGADLVSRYQSRTLTASDIENAVSHNIDDSDHGAIITGNTPLFDESPLNEKKS